MEVRREAGGLKQPGPAVHLRPAIPEDVPVLERLIQASARELSRGDYSPEQIEAALGTTWGVDSQLIEDGTYLVAEAAELPTLQTPFGRIVACGGWSFRNTLFGADGLPGRKPDLLDPVRDAARIRAFFVRPDCARRGIGALLLEQCEKAARANGFRATELVATLPGLRLYAARGYISRERIRHALPGGLTIEFVRMRKELE